MTHPGGAARFLPGPLRRHILDFEQRIERAVHTFAATLPDGARVLDAGAGESQYAPHFARQKYFAADLGVGDARWNYADLDCVADLARLPFPDGVFDAAINIVTLEHVPDPARVVAELARVLRSGGRLLLVVPHEWEEHQTPHDYYRYTRHGIRYLLDRAGLDVIRIDPAGGFFRLLARRLAAAPQFFPAPASLVVLALLALPVIILPWFDGLDRSRNFTLGFLCEARKL